MEERGAEQVVVQVVGVMVQQERPRGEMFPTLLVAGLLLEALAEPEELMHLVVPKGVEERAERAANVSLPIAQGL